MINKVILLGAVSEYGAKLQYKSNGQPEASFTLVVQEPGKDGTLFKTFIPVCILGNRAESVAETLEPHMLVAVDGKIAWRKGEVQKSGEKADGKLVVMAWDATPVLPTGIEQPELMAEGG